MTGLPGCSGVGFFFDCSRAGGGAPTAPDAADAVAIPSVFSAVREQLGLKLESSKTMRDTLIIDRLERPTEN
jgi:uncharacterized protein (TIGR03435 family)